MRKPAFCICENKDADQLLSDCAADQRLCFRYNDSTIPLFLFQASSHLLWLYSPVCVLVGNPKTGFLTTRLNFFWTSQVGQTVQTWINRYEKTGFLHIHGWYIPLLLKSEISRKNAKVRQKQSEPKFSPQNKPGNNYTEQNQRTNGPVNAHLISCLSKAQNIQNLENIW